MTDAPVPRITILCLAAASGVLVALAMQIALAQVGFEIGALFRTAVDVRITPVRSAMAWWLIAGVSLAAGWLIAVLVRALASAWSRAAALRWATGIAVTAAASALARTEAAPAGLPAAATVGLGIAVLLLAASLALLGAFLATRR